VALFVDCDDFLVDCCLGFSFRWVTGCAVGQRLWVSGVFFLVGNRLCGGSRLWVSVPVGFEVGCRVGLGGWQWWFPFLVDSGGFGCEFFLLFCFTLFQTHNVKYFPKHFPRMQTNTEKKLFSLKSFAFENIL
jgi:hypothetical protein